MPNTLLEHPAPEQKPTVGEERLLVQQVLARLGRPRNLHRIDARKVWGDRYRVNVYCADETDRPVKTVSMTDSFFVTFRDGELASNPPIARRYE
jgi:ketosteroid isomerase-like protein